ncbi:MAG: tetratricopeptide repeat protein [Deltaproteobacteria bacterium]|nr:tetratricopeptide repeat protein [Deltaproteobacteria bacterium]
MAETDLGRLKVLVVDDQALMRRTIKSILRQAGIEDIKEAEDGVVALRMLQQDTYNLVISDWNMPRMRGNELLRSIREDDQLKDIPFLMVTGEMDEAVVGEAGETNVGAYILKPFGAKTLLEKVAQLINRKKSPSKIDSCLQLAMTHLEAGEYDQALDQVQAARAINRNSPRVLYVSGLIFEAKKEHKKAERVYLKALELSPKFVKAHERLSYIYELAGKTDKVVEHLMRASEINPRNIDRQLNLGEKLLEQGDPDKAKEIFKHTQRISDVTTAELTKRIGDIYLKKEMISEAIDAYEKTAELLPDDVYVLNRMGISYRKLGEWDNALKVYKKALELCPEDENIYYNVGRTYLEMGNKYRALDYFEQALKAYPDFAEAKAVIQKLTNGS